jgi:hypothetical protein
MADFVEFLIKLLKSWQENIFSCGINSSEEKIKMGENNNCRIFKYSNEKYVVSYFFHNKKSG